MGSILEPRSRLSVSRACGRRQSKRWSERKVFVGAAESYNEVVLESADGTFSCIATVEVWWCHLEVSILVTHEFLQDVGALIVEASALDSA